MPVSVSGSVARLPVDERAAIPREVGRAGRAVEHREAVEQRRRADRADDQVLQARLQRTLAAHLGRAQHIEGNREQLEADEQRRPCSARRRAATMPAIEVSSSAWYSPWRGFARRQRAPGEQHGGGPAGDQDHLHHQRQVVDSQRPGDDRLCPPHCQIVRPSAAPRATSVAPAPAARAPSASRAGRPAARRRRRRAVRQWREAGEVDMGALQMNRWQAASRVIRGSLAGRGRSEPDSWRGLLATAAAAGRVSAWALRHGPA